jgi:hypothetical protein
MTRTDFHIVSRGAPVDEWLLKFKGRALKGWLKCEHGLILDFGDVGLLLRFPTVVQEVVKPNPTMEKPQ